MLAQASGSADPIDAAIRNYENIESYQVTLRSRSRDTEEVIRYFYRSPGFIRMEFITPHKGAVLVYDPVERKVRLRPFGFLKSFVFSLSPDSRLIKSAKGHRVDESDIGTLLRAARELQENGGIEVLGDEEVNERKTLVVSVKAEEGFSVFGINRYLLWLDNLTFLPLKAAGYGADGELAEEVLMDDLEVNVDFSEGFFSLGE